MCVYQGERNISFSENVYVHTKWMTPMGRFKKATIDSVTFTDQRPERYLK